MRLNKLLTLFFSLLLFNGCGNSTRALAQTNQTSPPFSQAAFRQTIEDLSTKHGARATIAGAWIGGQPIERIALGDSMTGVPATPDMTVRIGGVSQLFLGTAVMRLVDRGEISLDDRIGRWLPNLLRAEDVTIGMLVNNTAGYKDFVLNDDFVAQQVADPFRTFTPDELIQFGTVDGQLNFEPGTAQRYSHTEFVILGKVLEAANQRTMADIYQNEVLNPIGLSGTGYSSTPELPSPVLHAFSSDRGVYEDATFWNPSWPDQSGPLYSRLDDLGKFGSVFGKGTLLTPESFQQLVKRPDVAPPSGPYFATCFVVSNGWYFQNPNFNGYSGLFAYLPAEDLTIAIFATQPESEISGHPAQAMFVELVEELMPGYPLGL